MGGKQEILGEAQKLCYQVRKQGKMEFLKLWLLSDNGETGVEGEERCGWEGGDGRRRRLAGAPPTISNFFLILPRLGPHGSQGCVGETPGPFCS